MAPRDNSYIAVTASATPTLQDILDRVALAEMLTAKQKQEIRSALNVTAMWLHRTLGDISADWRYLRRAFEQLNFGTLGVGRARFRNVQSLLKQGLKAAGAPTSGAPSLVPLDPAWAAFRALLTDRYTKDCLLSLMRFCSTRGIKPEQVNDDVIQAYHEALLTENLATRPYTTMQSAIRLWNRVVDRVPDWPLQRLSPLRRFERYTLRGDQLPPDLFADIEHHLALLGGTDPTDPLAPPRPLKPRSIVKRRYEMLQLISALHHQGVDITQLHGLADLCRVDLIRKALSFFVARHRKRHGETADPAESSMIGGMAAAMLSLARHYVQAPAEIVAELSRIAGRLNHRQTGMTEKNRTRLAQLDSPLLEKRFLSHALSEMHKLARKNEPTRQDAVRYSVLLAIEILVVAPMRLQNVAHLDIEQHFSWPPRRRGDIGIVIPRFGVKNNQPLDYRISSGSSAMALYAYLDRFRPLLLSADSNALFPGRRGRAKRNDTLAKQITKLLRAELGIAWNAHLYRHFAVRLYLRAYPGDYEGARRLVAHLNGETTFQFYEGAEMRPAVERFDRVIESIREQDLCAPEPRHRRAEKAGRS